MFNKCKKLMIPFGAAILTLVLVGCGSSNQTPSLGSADLKKSSSRKIICNNPIQFEEKELKPVTDTSVIPKHLFKLSRIQLHEFWEGAQHSLTVSADRADGFNAKLECQGFYQSDEGQNEKFSSTFQINESIDLAQRKKSAQKRLISYEIENAEIQYLATRLLNDPKSVETEFDHITTSRMRLSQNRYQTYRLYLVTPNQLELRIKLENTPDQNGHRIITHFVAVYETEK